MARAKKPNKKTSSPVFGTSSSKIEDISNEGDRSKGENFLENPFQDIQNDEKHVNFWNIDRFYIYFS